MGGPPDADHIFLIAEQSRGGGVVSLRGAGADRCGRPADTCV
jgi:hypothetical protein